MVRPVGPVQVRRHVTESGKRGWQWTCAEHTRHRGNHWDYRWSDGWRRRRGEELPASERPWARAMRGALRHWHDYHAPYHACCEMCPDRITSEPREGVA